MGRGEHERASDALREKTRYERKKAGDRLAKYLANCGRSEGCDCCSDLRCKFNSNYRKVSQK